MLRRGVEGHTRSLGERADRSPRRRREADPAWRAYDGAVTAAETTDSVTTKKVLLAAPRGYCAGVDRAVVTVEKALELYGAPVYVRKEIVHNKHVVETLERRGAIFVEETEEVPEGSLVVFSAHGVAPSVHDEAAARNLRTIDATCPLVTKVHHEARRFADEGYKILLIGHEGHEEVVGTTGEAPEAITLVDGPSHADEVEIGADEKVVWLSQTTLSVDETVETVERLKLRLPLLVDPPSDDICYATQNRQLAVKDIAERCDVLVVVGSGNSSNSVRLVEVGLEAGAGAAYRVDTADELDEAWFAGASTVGLTSGASVPEILVRGVLTWLAERGWGDVEEISSAEEHLHLRAAAGAAPRPEGRGQGLSRGAQERARRTSTITRHTTVVPRIHGALTARVRKSMYASRMSSEPDESSVSWPAVSAATRNAMGGMIDRGPDVGAAHGDGGVDRRHGERDARDDAELVVDERVGERDEHRDRDDDDRDARVGEPAPAALDCRRRDGARGDGVGDRGGARHVRRVDGRDRVERGRAFGAGRAVEAPGVHGGRGGRRGSGVDGAVPRSRGRGRRSCGGDVRRGRGLLGQRLVGREVEVGGALGVRRGERDVGCRLGVGRVLGGRCGRLRRRRLDRALGGSVSRGRRHDRCHGGVRVVEQVAEGRRPGGLITAHGGQPYVTPAPSSAVGTREDGPESVRSTSSGAPRGRVVVVSSRGSGSPASWSSPSPTTPRSASRRADTSTRDSSEPTAEL